MGIELGKAWVRVRGDTANLKKDLEPAKKTATAMMTGIAGGITAAVSMAIIQTVQRAIASIKAVAMESIQLSIRQIDAEQRLAAAIRATGGAAGFTADQLKKQASELQALTTIGDEEILEMQAMLLTFRSIQKDIFSEAIESALDLAEAMGVKGKSSIMQLAKALEEPLLGLTMMRRSGVSFSEEQQKTIKNYVKIGQLVKAQRMILDVVQAQSKNIARSMALTPVGRLKQAVNLYGDIKEEIGERLLPVMLKFKQLQIDFMTYLRDNFVKISKHIEGLVFSFVTIIKVVGKFTVEYGVLIKNIGIATVLVYAFRTAWVRLGVAATAAGVAMKGALLAFAISTGGWLLIIGAVATAIYGLQSLWSDVKEETDDATESVNKYNTALKQLADTQDELSALQKEAAKPLEERVGTAKQTILAQELNDKLKEETKLIKQIAALRLKKGDETKSIIDKDIEAQRVANKIELEDKKKELNNLQKLRLEHLGRERTTFGLIPKPDPQRTQEMSVLAKQIEELEEIERETERRRATPEKLEAAGKRVEVLKEETAEMKRMKRIREGEVPESFGGQYDPLGIFGGPGTKADLDAAMEPFLKMQRFVDSLNTKTPQQQFDELAKKLREAAKAGIEVGDVQKTLDEQWKKSPMGKEAEQLAGKKEATLKNMEKVRDQLKVALGSMSDIDLKMKQWMGSFLTTPEQQQQMRALLEGQKIIAAPQERGRPEIEGRMGFRDYANRIQDALLKKDDPQKMLVALSKDQIKKLEKIEANTRTPQPMVLAGP